MKRLLSALGVDYEQWKALTIAALRMDMRATTFGGRGRRKISGRRAIIGQVVFYGLMGVVTALFTAYLGDRFLAATLLYSYVVVMVGTAMLVDHNTAITSPADYGILGFQPITSRTYFASKLANALVYTLAMTTALGVLPAGVIVYRYGLLVGAAAVFALYLCATTVTLAVVAGYAALMQRVGTRRLQTVLSYVQLMTGFLIYGGYFLTAEVFPRNVLATFHVERTPWLALYPATWFASWLEVADGSRISLDVGPVLATIAAIVFLATRLRGRLSLEYADRLGAIVSESRSTESHGRALRPGLWFRGGEARAVAILVRSHFRNDLKFRMGVLAVIPLTVIYLFMGLRRAAEDGAAASRGSAFSLVTIAVLLFPMLLKSNLAHSEAFRASWIFFSSPTDRTRLIRSAKNVLVAFFLLPYLAFVGAALGFFTRDAWYVIVYLLLVGSIGHIALMLLTLVDPEMPFSKPVEKGRGTSRIMGAMFTIILVGSFLPWILRAIVVSPTGLVITLAAILALTLLLGWLTRLRIERRAARLEFQG